MQRHIWFSKAVKHIIITVTMATDQSFVMFPQLDPHIVEPLYYPPSLSIDPAFRPRDLHHLVHLPLCLYIFCGYVHYVLCVPVTYTLTYNCVHVFVLTNVY